MISIDFIANTSVYYMQVIRLIFDGCMHVQE